MVFYPSPPTRAANFSNTEFSRECSKLRFGNRCAPLKCETVGQTAENVYIRGREGRGEGGMSTRCMYDGDKAHPPIMLSFSLRFLSPLFFFHRSFLARSPRAWYLVKREGQIYRILLEEWRGVVFVSSVRLKVTRARYESRSRAGFREGFARDNGPRLDFPFFFLFFFFFFLREGLRGALGIV